MTDHAIIAGSFSDFRIIKTRSTAQLIIEIPIEHADEALERLGGVPQSGKEKPVAVARLNLDVAREPAPQAPEKPKGGRRAREAGIACGEGAFAKYLDHTLDVGVCYNADTTVDPRQSIYTICGVKSRVDLDHNEEAGRLWDALYGGYIMWVNPP